MLLKQICQNGFRKSGRHGNGLIGTDLINTPMLISKQVLCTKSQILVFLY